MKTIRRLTTSIMSTVSAGLSQIENHEGLVTAAIAEANQATVRAKVQSQRVRNDGLKLRARLIELHNAEQAWKERAVKCAAEDEAKALECVKRLKRSQREIAMLEIQVRQHSETERQLTEDVAQLESRLGNLKIQRNLMRSRESRADAVRAIQSHEVGVLGEIDEIFERWECKVAQYEVESQSSTLASDDLEHEFIQVEEQAELRAELARLTAN